MSTVRRVTSLYDANLAAITALQPQHALQFQALTEGMTSAAIADLRFDLLNAHAFDSVDDVNAAWRAIETTLPWGSVFSDATYGEFSHVESLIESLRQHDHDELPGEIATLHDDLLRAIDAAHFETSGFEQQATAQAVDLALNDLGYYVERAEIAGVVTGFEASMGDAKLVVEVTSGGHVTTDFVGLSDTVDCGNAQSAFVERVSTYGVRLNEQERDDHRDTRGGGLVQRVARASGKTLAERIVSAHGASTASRRLTSRLRTSIANEKATA